MTVASGIFDHTVQETHEWLLDVMDELAFRDEHKAQRILRAVLHALRDRLTVNEAVQLAAQFPALLRGYYFEGFRPAGKPLRERRLEDFLDHIEEEFTPEEDVDTEEAARAVFKVLSQRISEGEISDIRAVLPAELRGLFPD